MGIPLQDIDFTRASARLRCDVAAVRAVAEVESAGSGFLPDGRVKVLFEGHWFARYTRGKYSAKYPDLSYPKWTLRHYARGRTPDDRGVGEWKRLQRAQELDRRAALLSASYGRFQIMGFNFAICGFSAVENFFQEMQRSEGVHLEAFCAYLEHNGLRDELQDKRWTEFARWYNGKEYWKQGYDNRLRAAYERLTARPKIAFSDASRRRPSRARTRFA